MAVYGESDMAVVTETPAFWSCPRSAFRTSPLTSFPGSPAGFERTGRPLTGTLRCSSRPLSRPAGLPGQATRQRTGSMSDGPKDAASSTAPTSMRSRWRTSTSTLCTATTGPSSPRPP